MKEEGVWVRVWGVGMEVALMDAETDRVDVGASLLSRSADLNRLLLCVPAPLLRTTDGGMGVELRFFVTLPAGD
jgi:hypothetical protein